VAEYIPTTLFQWGDLSLHCSRFLVKDVCRNTCTCSTLFSLCRNTPLHESTCGCAIAYTLLVYLSFIYNFAHIYIYIYIKAFLGVRATTSHTRARSDGRPPCSPQVKTERRVATPRHQLDPRARTDHRRGSEHLRRYQGEEEEEDTSSCQEAVAQECNSFAAVVVVDIAVVVAEFHRRFDRCIPCRCVRDGGKRER